MKNKLDFKKGHRVQYNYTVSCAGQFAGVFDRFEYNSGWKVYHSSIFGFNYASILELCKPIKEHIFPAYTAVAGESISQLQYEVGCHLDKGYMSQGGVSLVEGNYIRTMLKS